MKLSELKIRWGQVPPGAFSVAPRPGTGAWHGGPALSRASLPGKERTTSEKGAELGQRERRRGPSGATVGRACTERGIGRRELGTGVKGLGKLRRKFQLTVTAWLPNVCVGKCWVSGCNLGTP